MYTFLLALLLIYPPLVNDRKFGDIFGIALTHNTSFREVGIPKLTIYGSNFSCN